MKVSAFRLSGFRRQDVMADKLGVSGATICRDWKWLDELYQERAAENITQAKGIDLERIDELIFALWPRAKGGEIDAIQEIRALLRSRAKLLGLDAPLKVAGDPDNPLQISILELAQMMARQVEIDGNGNAPQGVVDGTVAQALPPRVPGGDGVRETIPDS